MRTLALVVLWMVGTAASIAIASAGVAIVNDEVIDPAPAILSTTGSPVGDSPTDAVEDTTTDESPGSAATDDGVGGGTVQPQTTTTPPTTAVEDPGPTSVEVTTTVPPPTTTQPPTAPPPTSPPTSSPSPPATQTLTFQLVGGSTAISFSPAGVDVLWASPNPGFEVKIEPESPGTKVEFRSDNHRSRVDAWWADGPRHEIREEADD